MTMHLHHPALSLNGKYKGKRKFRNADQAKKHRELKDSWDKLKEKWQVEVESKKKNNGLKAPEYQPEKLLYRGHNNPKIPSIDTGHKGAVSTKPSPIYTGNNIVGIGTMHKSNAVPIFSQDEAKSISSMRR